MTEASPAPVVLVENGDHSHTSRGDGAMLKATVDGIRRWWPAASFGVVSASPTRLRLIDPSLHSLPEDQPEQWMAPRPSPRFVLPDRALDVWWGATGRWLAGRNLRRALRSRGLPASLAELRPGRRARGLGAAPLRPALTVAVGGGYFCDMDADRALSVLDTLEWAAGHGSITALASQGIGPLTHEGLRQRMAEVLPKVDLILLRERLTGPAILAQLGVRPEKVEVVGDDAISLATRPPLELGSRGRIGVSLRSAGYLELGARDADALSAAVATAAAALAAPVRPFAACEWRHEDRLANRILAGKVERFEPDLRPSASPQDFSDAVGTCRVVVTMTYHAAVFALSQGIPAVCAYRSPYHFSKLAGLADLFDGEGVTLVNLHDGGAPAALAGQIMAAWRSASAVAGSLRQKAERIRRNLARSYQRLAGLVEAGHVSGRKQEARA